ncbi:MAG: hypothetical protein ACK2U6_19540, partial [Candidatus Promineifilaceae bacterium]
SNGHRSRSGIEAYPAGCLLDLYFHWVPFSFAYVFFAMTLHAGFNLTFCNQTEQSHCRHVRIASAMRYCRASR